jgi:hypothetical protein
MQLYLGVHWQYCRFEQHRYTRFPSYCFCAGLMLLGQFHRRCLAIIMTVPLFVLTEEEHHSVIRFCGRKAYQGPQSIENFGHNT